MDPELLVAWLRPQTPSAAESNIRQNRDRPRFPHHSISGTVACPQFTIYDETIERHSRTKSCISGSFNCDGYGSPMGPNPNLVSNAYIFLLSTLDVAYTDVPLSDDTSASTSA